MKNILILVGSANKNGNTARLAAAFAEGAKAAGHTDRKMDPRHLADARALGASL